MKETQILGFKCILVELENLPPKAWLLISEAPDGLYFIGPGMEKAGHLTWSRLQEGLARRAARSSSKALPPARCTPS